MNTTIYAAILAEAQKVATESRCQHNLAYNQYNAAWDKLDKARIDMELAHMALENVQELCDDHPD